MSERVILAVDDDPAILRLVSFVLTREGYRVETARNGQEALEKMRMVKPDLALIDVMMPNMNGYTLCKEIRQDPDLKGVYLIVLTARCEDKERTREMEMGPDDFVAKPFSPAAMVKRVKEFFDQIGKDADAS